MFFIATMNLVYMQFSWSVSLFGVVELVLYHLLKYRAIRQMDSGKKSFDDTKYLWSLQEWMYLIFVRSICWYCCTISRLELVKLFFCKSDGFSDRSAQNISYNLCESSVLLNLLWLIDNWNRSTHHELSFKSSWTRLKLLPCCYYLFTHILCFINHLAQTLNNFLFI